jgi:UDP-hydrolysing UDP-N-acetyl-D-glucosamine 2-epimerase
VTTVGVVTSARSDLGAYLPVMRAIHTHPKLDLRIVATGMHLAPAFGLTVQHIQEEGFCVHERVESFADGDKPESIGESMGRGVMGFAQLFARWRPDVLVVLGDRYDMYPAALAALPFCIPVAHIAGGEITEGAIDDALRHSITKLSHLHFVATAEYAERVLQMGEEPWRVLVSGAPTLDNLRQSKLWSREETARRFGFDLGRPVALVTYHPVTLEYDGTADQIRRLLNALDSNGIQCVFTHPNADTASSEVITAIERFCHGHSDRRLVVNAGQIGYFSLMNAVSVMVGNSSSGLVEAPSFKLPVVNVGNRQKGRLRAANVIDCGYSPDEIGPALECALSSHFRASLHQLQNPYGDGHAAERIVQRLASLDTLPDLLGKRFTQYRLHCTSKGTKP